MTNATALRDEDVERALGSAPDFHADPVEQLAFELAFELEIAELNPDDLVTLNRDKLRAIAARVAKRAALSAVPQAGVPEGYRLVPEEPEPLAVNALAAALGVRSRVARSAYDTVLRWASHPSNSTAPPPPAPAGDAKLRSALAEAMMQTAPSHDGRASHARQLHTAHERIAELCAELGVTTDDFGGQP